MTDKIYLGDGVYAYFDGFHIVLTATSRGQENIIFLDSSIVKSLEVYIKAMREAKKIS